MSEVLSIAAIVVAVFLIGAAVERYRLRQFWNRRCTGVQWRRSFPKAPKAEIRCFLDMLLSAFAFSESKRLCFAPDDLIMAIYSALYPHPKVVSDSMELETFVMSVQDHYGVDLFPIWRDDITLGELFSHATNVAS